MRIFPEYKRKSAIKARIQVTATLTIDPTDAWSNDCTFDQIDSQAVESASHKLLQLGALIAEHKLPIKLQINGKPVVTMISDGEMPVLDLKF